MEMVESVGYWIIVALIVLGGILVFIAALSVDSNDVNENTSVRAQPQGQPIADRVQGPHEPDHQVSLIIFMPQMWLQGEQTLPDLGIRGVASRLRPVKSSLLSDVVAAVDSERSGLVDSIAVILLGADEFLAGHPLDSVLNDLDRLLDHLVNQPAMAVIGSVPDIGPAIADTLVDVSAESISTTVALWNAAITDLSQSYSAEFVDLSEVPVKLVMDEGEILKRTLSATPDLTLMATTLKQACSRAADRIRSIRVET